MCSRSIRYGYPVDFILEMMGVVSLSRPSHEVFLKHWARMQKRWLRFGFCIRYAPSRHYSVFQVFNLLVLTLLRLRGSSVFRFPAQHCCGLS